MTFDEFQKKINITLKDKSLLEQAFTHRSYINENRGSKKQHNERLEFLGDAVLELVVTQFLYLKFPEKNEGDLTAYRAALVNTDSLARTAEELNMDALLLLSKGEAKDTGRARYYILANSVEALIGAIYLDQGYDKARMFIEENITPRINEIIKQGTWIDAKSRFQEKSQDEVSITPTYKTIKEEGPDHDKSFTVGVYLDEELIAQGEGRSKQDAEQSAAKRALEAKDWM